LETKLKGVDEKFSAQTLKNFGRMKFDTDEEFETFLEEIESDAAAFTQNLSDKSLSQQRKPLSGQKTEAEASKAEVDAVLDKII